MRFALQSLTHYGLSVIVLSLVSLSSPAQTPQPAIVNGLADPAYPAVGTLVGVDRGEQFCSATLVGCDLALTAAHCVCQGDGRGDDCQNGGPRLLDPTSLMVFFQNDGPIGVQRIRVPPYYRFGITGDVALLELSRPVTGITPIPINELSRPPQGSRGTIVGFGQTGGFSGSAGLKLHGGVTTGSCNAADVPDSEHICWSFRSPVGAPQDDASVCFGDSGGPLLMDLGAGLSVAGITSGVVTGDCLPPTEVFEADVYVNRGWLRSQGVDFGGPACGRLPPAGEPGGQVSAILGSLTNEIGQQVYQIPVTADTSLLRVGLNGEESNTFSPNDFDLYLRFGTPPTLDTFDCRPYFNGSYELCEQPLPAVGEWYALVDRFGGSGLFQLTATRFQRQSVWFDPTRNGVGVTLDQDNTTLGGAIYLYDRAGNPLWLTFLGTLTNNALNATLLRFSGPPQAQYDPALVQSTPVGSASLLFTSATSAILDITVDGVSERLQLTPFATASEGIYAGAWLDPARNGSGITLSQEGGVLNGAWYLYQDDGSGLWLTFQGAIQGNTVSTDLLAFQGPPLGQPFNGAQVNASPVGRVDIFLDSSQQIRFRYQLNGTDQTLTLQPLFP